MRTVFDREFNPVLIDYEKYPFGKQKWQELVLNQRYNIVACHLSKGS